MRTDIDEKKEQIIQWLEDGTSRVEVARRLKCRYDTLKARLDKWNCTLKNQPGKNMPKPGCQRHASTYLNRESTISADKLKKKLWRDGIKERCCEHCGITHWQGKPAPLELDHLDGDKWNNCIENLRILCANCHGIQPTNGGKNIGRVAQLVEAIGSDPV